MHYVGIDISRYKHDCVIMTDLGEVVNDGFSFANNAEGFAMLQHKLELCGKGNTRIGFEATGNYGINFKLFLERSGYDYMEINPLLIKEYIKSKSLRRTKTDKLDAIAIASYISVGDCRTHKTSFYQQFSLKCLQDFETAV